MKVSDIKKYKESLYAALSRDLADFEKNFLLIAAGVLTFSITFIKDIVNISEARCLALLFFAWGGFALAVGLMMFTLIQSAYASDEISFAIEDYIQKKDKWEADDDLDAGQTREIRILAEKIFRKRKCWLKVLRYAAIAVFLIGFACFGYFVADNLSREASSKKAASTTLQVDKAARTVTVDGWKLSWKDSTLAIEKAK
jgi:hypothetical protein